MVWTAGSRLGVCCKKSVKGGFIGLLGRRCGPNVGCATHLGGQISVISRSVDRCHGGSREPSDFFDRLLGAFTTSVYNPQFRELPCSGLRYPMCRWPYGLRDAPETVPSRIPRSATRLAVTSLDCWLSLRQALPTRHPLVREAPQADRHSVDEARGVQPRVTLHAASSSASETVQP